MSGFFMHETLYRDLAPAAEQPVTICGAGALGANLAETLARMGLRRLRVIDRDRIAAHNLSTQPWTQQDVGAPKARALANALYRAVGTRVEPRHVELDTTNAATLLEHSRVVVDAFDNVPARRAVSEEAAALELPCLHVGLGGAGDYGCGLWDDRYQLPSTPTGMDGCDYPLSRPLVLLVAAAAAEVLVDQLLSKRRRDFEVTLRDLRITSK
jgi:predicted ThiF/HesA family dinucleotide-utilizing enzyme